MNKEDNNFLKKKNLDFEKLEDYCWKKDVEKIRELLRESDLENQKNLKKINKYDLASKDGYDYTYLGLCCVNGCVEIVRLLLLIKGISIVKGRYKEEKETKKELVGNTRSGRWVNKVDIYEYKYTCIELVSKTERGKLIAQILEEYEKSSEDYIEKWGHLVYGESVLEEIKKKLSVVTFFGSGVFKTNEIKSLVNYKKRTTKDEEYLEFVFKDLKKINKYYEKNGIRTSSLFASGKVRMRSRTILDTIEDCIEDSEDFEVLHIFYSGHGKIDSGDWCCFDKFISFEKIFSILQNNLNQGKRIVLITDCCFSGIWIDKLNDKFRNRDYIDLVIISSSESDEPAIDGEFASPYIELQNCGFTDKKLKGKISIPFFPIEINNRLIYCYKYCQECLKKEYGINVTKDMFYRSILHPNIVICYNCSKRSASSGIDEGKIFFELILQNNKLLKNQKKIQ